MYKSSQNLLPAKFILSFCRKNVQNFIIQRIEAVELRRKSYLNRARRGRLSPLSLLAVSYQVSLKTQRRGKGGREGTKEGGGRARQGQTGA